MWILSLVFSTRCHPYLPCAMLQQKARHSFRAYHGGDTVDKNQEQSNMRDMQCSGKIL